MMDDFDRYIIIKNYFRELNKTQQKNILKELNEIGKDHV